jgi:hypothetical protein
MEPVTVLMRDPACVATLPGRSGWRVVKRPDTELIGDALNILVLVAASDLSAVSDFVREANRTHHLRALLVRADVDALWVVQMLARAELRTLRNLLVHEGPAVPRRVFGAWKLGAQRQLVADARVVGDRLMVVSCAMERLEVGFADVPALARLPAEERARFEIADDGSYLHWPVPDVHLDLDALRVAVDPKARAVATVERLRHDERFGRAAARVREKAGLRQEDVPGVSARQVRRIEAGAFPRVTTLAKLAEAHGLDPRAYLDRIALELRD